MLDDLNINCYNCLCIKTVPDTECNVSCDFKRVTTDHNNQYLDAEY